MTASDRTGRARRADQLCAEAYKSAGCPEAGVALVAVGGYGRAELAPYSDLDVVLVHDPGVEPGEWAASIWYPLWDSGASIDHSVRTLPEAAEQAAADLKVALGLLDARVRLPELRALVSGRADRLGELAHSSVPDLKESVGGLRDATVLKALVATWLVDVPHAELERARTSLLDVRDALHEVAGRATDRVLPEYWPDIAERLGLAEATVAQRHTRALGRRVTHISRLTWGRAEAVLQRPTVTGARRPSLETVAPGVAVSRGEVVLAAHARPGVDACLLLRAAVEAAERGLVLAPATAARLARECPPLSEPWPPEARDLLVRLLASGSGLLPVWETLDETEGITTFLPEWELVRLLPHASVVHRFTVDRHLVETCVEAAGLIRRVARPDVLMVAALLHDIGKGRLTEHCVAGEPLARAIAARMGLGEREVDLVGHLVRWHLLLPDIATTRDPDDPATMQAVLDRVPDREELELLVLLTEADARATSEQAWTSWRSSLVQTLVRRVLSCLDESSFSTPSNPVVEIPDAVRADPAAAAVQVTTTVDGSEVTVISGDRLGLLADAAAMLALGPVSVRAARAWTVEGIGVSQWQVVDTGLDAAVLRQRLESVATGRVDVSERLGRHTPARLEPTVAVRPEASAQATVLEVRTENRPGVIHVVCRALAGLGLSVRSAHVATLGPQAVDAFYVQESGVGALTDSRAAEAALAVRAALLDTVTLTGVGRPQGRG